MRSQRGLVALAASALSAGCVPPGASDGRILRSERNDYGLVTCSEATRSRTCHTNRSVIGVSMGAAGAGQLGFSHPELFDAVGMMGISLVDWVYMLRLLERFYTGGFCDMHTILAHLDEVGTIGGPAFCGPVRGVDPLEPTAKVLEADQDFNHLYRWIDAGRGSDFGRTTFRESIQDIALAFGNPAYYNPESPYFPPGVPLDYRERSDEDRCRSPAVIHGLKHAEYNPRGEYDVIAFCDTDTPNGEFRQDEPADMAAEVFLSVDYNGNRIRDYAEPILVMAHERFEDVGSSPFDQYDWRTHATGTRGNGRYDESEPFRDDGLDGVPGTGDYGEGNGRFDYGPNLENAFRQSPRHLIETLPAGHLERLSIWADAGIRDFLMSAGATNWLWAALQTRVGADRARDYTGFGSLLAGSDEYDFLAVDYSPEGIGQHAYVRYGDPNAPERVVQHGDGHHVGTPDQILHRLLTGFAFAQSRFLDRDDGAIADAGDVTALIRAESFHSDALGADRPFGVLLPPGYDAPENHSHRYPVVYFLHGTGMEALDLTASSILFFGYMSGSAVPEKQRARASDWSKFIIVFPDSSCARPYCKQGSFNTNHRGLDGNGPRYFDSLLELMAHVEKRYRVLPPVEVER